jgi:acyl-CoA synthetase (AMP-forming)/AMP-acid ligase II
MNSRYLINTAVREYPDNTALICSDKRLTFRQLDDRVNRLANALLDLGLRSGDRVAILMKNCVEYIDTDFALSKTGLVRVALNYRLGAEDHEYVMKDSGAKALIYNQGFSGDVAAMRGRLHHVEHFICVGDGGPDDLEGGVLRYDELLAASVPDDPGVETDESGLHQLTYTSGTTGNPKGVMISDKAWCAATINIVLNYGPIGETDVIVNLQQLSHGAGYFVMPYFIKGATNILLDFDPMKVFETVQAEKVTVVKLVPVMLYNLVDAIAGQQYDLSSLKHIIYGGSPITRPRLVQALEAFGPIFSQLYGQAEVPMCMTTLSRQDHKAEGSLEETKRLESAGKPCTNVEIKIVDEDRKEVGPGEKGEVAARGELIMDGYWNMPDTTGEVLRDGWVYTGDMGYMDSRGFVFLVDRKKDIIISGGFNIYPAEVEKVIVTHPGVKEVSVIGVPDDKWGEAVKAVVVLKSGASATGEEIIAFCKQNGLGFRSPKSVDFKNGIPRNPYGKVDKKRLREPYWEGMGKQIN